MSVTAAEKVALVVVLGGCTAKVNPDPPIAPLLTAPMSKDGVTAGRQLRPPLV